MSAVIKPDSLRPDASADAICAYPACGSAFKPKRRWQRYCDDPCRRAHHAMKDDGGRRGVITSGPRVLKSGDYSITIRVPAGTDVSQLRPGRVMEIL